jgi:tetratricopeptide (TPR) repeat protein
MAISGRTVPQRHNVQKLILSRSLTVFLLARRFDLANDRAQKLLEVAPDFAWARFEMAQVYEHQGHLQQAARESLKVDELFETDHKKLAQLKEAMASSGAQGYWRRTLENYKRLLLQNTCLLFSSPKPVFAWVTRSAR